MIDANDPADSTPIDKFLDDLNLTDLMAPHLPTNPPKTYQRGRQKIDHIFGTMGINIAVTRAYVLPFGKDTPRSDHAICGIDFSLDVLCGISPESLYDPTHPSARQLWSTDIKAAERYVEMVERRFAADNIAERVQKLMQRCTNTGKCSENDEAILNAIDANITKILLWAEAKCKRAKGHDWSPLLANAGRTVIAAKWHLSNIMTGRTMIPTGITRETAIAKARSQIKDAYDLLRKVQKNAKQIRESFLEDRAEHLEETREISKAAALRQLIAAERSSSIFKRLGKWFKAEEFTRMDRILVPDDPTDLTHTTWSSVIEAQALFEVLTKDCQEHFHQAADTPFVTGPIADKIGPFADNEYCDSVLEGTFDFNDIAETVEVEDIIKGMRYPDTTRPTPPIDSTIDEEGFVSAIAHTRERTSSSPSGRHYGHYRALLRKPAILGLIAHLANFCFKWGVTMQRWTKVIQPQIPKDKGTPLITRIRRITLIEADLNISLSELFGRRMMDNAEKHKLLHPQQYGSRKGRMAISAVLLKRLSYDVIRQSRMDAVMFDNDARACYDRIIPSLAAVASRRAGMPRAAASAFLRMLFLMTYFVRTAYGVASNGYSNAIQWLLGVMQGAGHSGALWALTSSVMLDQMETEASAVFHSPFPNTESCRRNGEAFVDDASLWTACMGIFFITLVQTMCNTAQRWERLLYATGGALNLMKCFWYGVQWHFTDSGVPKMMRIKDDDPGIELTCGSNLQIKHSIKRIETTKGMRTLGVRLAPNGNDQDEFNYRMEEATTMRDRLKVAPLNREHVGVGFRNIWKMKLLYPVGATCFTNKQCQRIQARYLSTFLSKMGINRTTSSAVRHGPLSLGGMDIFHLATEQAVQHTKLMLSHLRKNDEIGRMLKTSIDHMQLQAGTSWTVLSKPGQKVRMYVDPCYVSHTWEFLDGIGCHIRLEPKKWMQPQRMGDSFIMDDVANLNGIKKIDLAHVQRVRLFLGVTTLADISNSDGTSLCEWALNASGNPRDSVFHFPRQERPRAANVINTWKRVIRLCYAQRASRKLDHPMGPWHKGRIKQVWDTVIDSTTGIIHIWENGRVLLYEKRNRSEYRYVRQSRQRSFPITSVPISGTLYAGTFTTSGYSQIERHRTPTPKHKLELRMMNRGVMRNTTKALIAKAIWEGRAIMGTDGSVKGSSATYSFVISMSQTDVNTNVKGGGFLPAPPHYMAQSSKRTEAAALYAGIRWVKALLESYPNHTNSEPPTLPIPIDNDSVVKDVNRLVSDQSPTFSLLSPDYDIIQAIRSTLKGLPVPTEVFHVKGHQDRHKQWTELDTFAKINVLADQQAEAIHQKSLASTGEFPPWVPGTSAALFHGDRQVTTNISSYIREAKHAPEMRKYLIRRSKEATGRDKPWDEAIYDTIAWKHYGEAFKKLSLGRRIQISKYANDLLPTRRRLQSIDNRVDGRCFACNNLWEDTTHVLTCSCSARTASRTTARATFQQRLSRMHTPDIMNKLICDSMDSWLARRPVLPPTWPRQSDTIQRQLRLAFEAQSRIGWDQFFRGRIAKAWMIPIGTYYKARQPGEAFTPEHWMRKTISEIWTFSITIWKQRNTEYHGTDGNISLEHRRTETANAAEQVYRSTIGNVSPTDSIVLHHSRVEEILTWTQEHLDAYLLSADIIIAQRDEAAG